MNNKSKVSYHLSKNEFWMLIILAAVVIVALGVIYLVTPGLDTLAVTKQQYEMAAARLEVLRQDNAQLQQYLAQEAEADTELMALRERMPDFYSQEITLKTFNALSEKNGLDLVSVSFGGVKTDPRSAFLAQLRHENVGEAQTDDVYVRYETIQIGFSGTYQALFGFLGDLEKETRAIFARELVTTRAVEGTVTGGLTLLVMSGPAKEGEEYPAYDYDAPAASGKLDPFAAFPGYYEGEQSTGGMVLTGDFYVILNTYDDNGEKLLFGQYGDVASELTSSENKAHEASIVVEEQNGALSYTYTLGDKKYTGKLTPSEEHPDLIVLSILSRARKNATDKVGLTLSVTNNTSLVVVLDVRNDDTTSPRFKAGTLKGIVQIGK